MERTINLPEEDLPIAVQTVRPSEQAEGAQTIPLLADGESEVLQGGRVGRIEKQVAHLRRQVEVHVVNRPRRRLRAAPCSPRLVR